MNSHSHIIRPSILFCLLSLIVALSVMSGQGIIVLGLACPNQLNFCKLSPSIDRLRELRINKFVMVHVQLLVG